MSSKEEIRILKDKLNDAWSLIQKKNGQIKHYCNIVSSRVIKKTIIDRCTQLGITPYEVCSRTDLKWFTFNKNYLKESEPKSSPAIRSDDIIKFARMIGIHIKIEVILDNVENVDIEGLKDDNIRFNDTHK